MSQTDTLTLLCERCSSSEHSHVKIEGSRLLAAIVKYCKSDSERSPYFSSTLSILHACILLVTEVMRRVLSEGGIKLIISLLESEHVLLCNEALVALNLLAVLGADEGEEDIDPLGEDVVLSGVWGVVGSDDSSPELLINALNFLHQLSQTHTGLSHSLQYQPISMTKNLLYYTCIHCMFTV